MCYMPPTVPSPSTIISKVPSPPAQHTTNTVPGRPNLPGRPDSPGPTARRDSKTRLNPAPNCISAQGVGGGVGWRCALTGTNISPLVSRTFVCAWDLDWASLCNLGVWQLRNTAMGAGKQVWQVLWACIRTAWVYWSRFLGRLFFLGFEPFLPLGYPRHFADDEAGRRPPSPGAPRFTHTC